MIKAALIKDVWLGLAYSFRGSVHYHHGRKQADMVLEKLRVLHLDPKAGKETVFCRNPGGGSLLH